MKTQVFHYRDPAAVSIGLGELRRKGLTPRGILFAAIDPRGETWIACPDDMDKGAKVRVGDKMSLEPPFTGRYYHFDAIHRLPIGGVLWNGDRRLKDTGSAQEVAVAIAEWVKGAGAKNVFLGCTPHQPGTWWTKDERSQAVALHERGYCEVVTVGTSLLARRIGEARLYHASKESAATIGLLDAWSGVFNSPLGNIIMMERRVLSDRLVLTCEHGLVEVDVSALPLVKEHVRVELASGFGVVGRVDGGAFAVTSGEVQPWGLEAVKPALLVGSEGDTLRDLARSLHSTP